MSLPIAGSPRPARPQTHKPIDLQRLIAVAAELDDAFELIDGDALTPEIVAELADDIGTSQLNVYVAATMMTDIPCNVADVVRFELCVGGCQGWGSNALLQHLLKTHAQQRDKGEAGFGIVTKRCLDLCDRAAVVRVHTPDGVATLPAATTDALDEAIPQVCP